MKVSQTLKKNLAIRYQGLMLLLFPVSTAEAIGKEIGEKLSSGTTRDRSYPR